MNDQIQGQEICTLLRFYEELVKFLLVQEYQLLDRFAVRRTLNLTKIYQNIFAQKCSSEDWSNRPIRLKYMLIYGQTFHSYSSPWGHHLQTTNLNQNTYKNYHLKYTGSIYILVQIHYSSRPISRYQNQYIHLTDSLL